MARQSIKISVTADTKKFRSELGKIGQSEGGIGKLKQGFSALGIGMKGLAAGVVGFGATAAFAIGKQAVGAASNLQQSMGAVDDVFKSSAKQVHSYAKSAAEAVGLSRNQYNEMATLIGTQLKNGGTAANQLADQANKVIKIGADLSAQFGGNTKDAVDALSAALKGERDPIEKYGISLTQNAIDAEAAALGYKKVNGQLTTQATQAATLSLIQKQSADSTGKFARETDTLAHKQQVLSAKWEDAKAKLGNMLLPIVTKITGFIADYVVPLIGKLPGLLSGLGRIIGGVFVGAWRLLVGVVQTAAAALQIAWEVIKLVFQLGVTAVSAVMSGLATVVGWAWEGVKAVFSGAVAVVKAAWEGFVALLRGGAAVIGAVFTGIGTVASWVWNGIKAVISGAGAVIQAVWAGIKTAAGWLGNAFQGLLGVVKSVWNGIKSVIGWAAHQVKITFQTIIGSIGMVIGWFGKLLSKVWGVLGQIASSIWNAITKVVSWVAQIPGKIVKAFGDAGSILLNVGKKIIGGLWNGIRSGFGAIKDGFKWLTSKLTSWKGPEEVDKRLLYGAGRLIIGGLVQGMESQYSTVRGSLQRLTRGMPGMVDSGALAATGGGIPLGPPAWAAVPRETRPVNITLQSLTADARSGQAVVDAIREYERLTGRTLVG